MPNHISDLEDVAAINNDNSWSSEQMLKNKNLLMGFYFLAYLSGLISFQTKAEMVYPMEVNIGKSGISTINVKSESDKVTFERVEVKKILNPGTREEKEVPYNMADEEGNFVVTPTKFIIQPNGDHTVRLISASPPEKEAALRVYFSSVSEDDFNDNKSQAKPKNVNGSVGVKIVWGALVHIAPRNPVVNLKIDEKTGNLINDGTMRAILTEIGSCSSSGKCVWKENYAVIYPGTHVKIKTLDLKRGFFKARFKNWMNEKGDEVPLPMVNG